MSTAPRLRNPEIEWSGVPLPALKITEDWWDLRDWLGLKKSVTSLWSPRGDMSTRSVPKLLWLLQSLEAIVKSSEPALEQCRVGPKNLCLVNIRISRRLSKQGWGGSWNLGGLLFVWNPKSDSEECILNVYIFSFEGFLWELPAHTFFINHSFIVVQLLSCVWLFAFQ